MISTAHLIASWTESLLFFFFFFGGVVDAVERGYHLRERETNKTQGASKASPKSRSDRHGLKYLSLGKKYKRGGGLQGN